MGRGQAGNTGGGQGVSGGPGRGGVGGGDGGEAGRQPTKHKPPYEVVLLTSTAASTPWLQGILKSKELRMTTRSA